MVYTFRNVPTYLCNLLNSFRPWHIYASVYYTITGSDRGLSLAQRQAIVWTNTGILLNGSLGINLSEILAKIHIFSFNKMHLKVPTWKWQPFCLGLNMNFCASKGASSIRSWNYCHTTKISMYDKIKSWSCVPHEKNIINIQPWLHQCAFWSQLMPMTAFVCMFFVLFYFSMVDT